MTAVPHDGFLIVDSHADLLRRQGLDTIDALFAVPNDQALNKPGLDSFRERLRITLDDDGRKRIFYLKRFRNPSRRARREMRRSDRGVSSLAGLEWSWIQRLRREGVACVNPVAFGEELNGSRELRSAILVEAVPGRSLECWVSCWNEDDRPTVRGLLPPFASLVARLHDRGFVHRDLYLAHVFYDPSAMLDRSLHLIDLQRVFRPRWCRGRWIVKDLASLNFSAPLRLISWTDRLRWLKHYLDQPRLDASAKRLAYRIIGKTCRIARHERRRGQRG